MSRSELGLGLQARASSSSLLNAESFALILWLHPPMLTTQDRNFYLSALSAPIVLPAVASLFLMLERVYSGTGAEAGIVYLLVLSLMYGGVPYFIAAAWAVVFTIQDGDIGSGAFLGALFALYAIALGYFYVLATVLVRAILLRQRQLPSASS